MKSNNEDASPLLETDEQADKTTPRSPDGGFALEVGKWIGLILSLCAALSAWLLAFWTISQLWPRLPEEVFRGPQPYSKYRTTPPAPGAET